MSRTLVIGDIHGGLRALHQVLERSKVSTEDTLIFLGDFVDGWSESPQVLDFLITLEYTHNSIFVRGNHDDLLLDWLSLNHESIDEDMWMKHGGKATVEAYKKVSEETKNKHIAFLKSLKNYHLDSENRLFVHAGFTNINGVENEYFKEMLYWDRTLWETAMSVHNNLSPNHPFFPKRLTLYKEIYIGHTPVTRINKTTPVQKANVWNVDTGAAFKGRLTIMDTDTKEFWQSDNLTDLYPDEKGRN